MIKTEERMIGEEGETKKIKRIHSISKWMDLKAKRAFSLILT